MKALTITQPWATLVAIGAKRIETRSWSTNYHGPLAIHAAKGMPKWAQDVCYEEPFFDALMWNLPTNPSHKNIADRFPRGAVIATCRLAGCVLVPKSQRENLVGGIDQPVLVPPNEPELSFGDYAYGRWAWILDNIEPLSEPIPVKGALGLWEWNQS